MLALIAALLFILAGFEVDLGDVSPFDFVAFGLALLALHMVVGDKVAIPRRG